MNAESHKATTRGGSDDFRLRAMYARSRLSLVTIEQAGVWPMQAENTFTVA